MALLAALALACAALFGVPAAAAEPAGRPPMLSQQMLQGIYFYEHGEDGSALDLFSNVMLSGTPAERSLASDYIDLLTNRLNPANKVWPIPNPVPGAARKVSVAQRALGAVSAAVRAPFSMVALLNQSGNAPPEMGAWPKAVRTRHPLMSLDDLAVRREVKAHLAQWRAAGIKTLEKAEGVQVLLRQDGKPAAVALPSPVVFSKGTDVAPGADPLLAALAKLAYGVGEAQIEVLPEGTAFKAARVLDMRRAMAVAAYLSSRGISTCRIRVDLLNTGLDIPRPLGAFKGLVVLFQYHKAFPLDRDALADFSQGPPVSLGIYPSKFSTAKGGGSVIEFSVENPPDGIASWKLDIFAPQSPIVRKAPPPQPIEGILGVGPIYQQIFWNGRKDFWGDPLPSGRYLCRLTATDLKNRTVTLDNWIDLEGAPVPAAPLVAKAAPKAAAQVMPALARGKPRHHKKAARRRRKTHRPALGPFHLVFESGSFDLRPDREKALARIARAHSFYRGRAIKVVGYADPQEDGGEGASKLALKRGEMAAGILINRYEISPSDISISTVVASGASPDVKLGFAGKHPAGGGS